VSTQAVGCDGLTIATPSTLVSQQVFPEIYLAKKTSCTHFSTSNKGGRKLCIAQRGFSIAVVEVARRIRDR
jgi:hypothetical protein